MSHLRRTKPPFEKVVGFLKQNDLSLVQADKEGGFVVLPKGFFPREGVDSDC